MGVVYATATACLVRLLLHFVTLVVRARLRNALWHYLTQQQLDPSASYKKKLSQYSLHDIMAEATKKTEEDIVRGSEEEKKLPSKRPNKSPSRTGFYSLGDQNNWHDSTLFIKGGH